MGLFDRGVGSYGRYMDGFGRTMMRPTFGEVMTPFAVFGIGMLLGAGVTLLIAPKSGRELRGDLSRQANRLTGTVRDRMQGQGVGQGIGQGQGQSGEWNTTTGD